MVIREKEEDRNVFVLIGKNDAYTEMRWFNLKESQIDSQLKSGQIPKESMIVYPDKILIVKKTEEWFFEPKEKCKNEKIE